MSIPTSAVDIRGVPFVSILGLETWWWWKETPKKSIHAKGWCGLGHVLSFGDFDGLDAAESRFLRP